MADWVFRYFIGDGENFVDIEGSSKNWQTQVVTSLRPGTSLRGHVEREFYFPWRGQIYTAGFPVADGTPSPTSNLAPDYRRSFLPWHAVKAVFRLNQSASDTVDATNIYRVFLTGGGSIDIFAQGWMLFHAGAQWSDPTRPPHAPVESANPSSTFAADIIPFPTVQWIGYAGVCDDPSAWDTVNPVATRRPTYGPHFAAYLPWKSVRAIVCLTKNPMVMDAFESEFLTGANIRW